MSVNSIIDKVYVINLDKDTERLARFDEQMKEHRIEYTRVSAVVGSTVKDSPKLTPWCNQFCTNGMKGCALSHQQIWNDMLKHSYKNVLVFEDDAILEPNFNAVFKEAWDELPHDFDIFYLGCTVMCDNSYKISKAINTVRDTPPVPLSEHIHTVKGSIGTHSYIISNKCAKLFSNLSINFHIDSEITKWIGQYGLSAYSCNPLIVKVRESDSGSNLSEAYPPLLNTLLHPVKISEGAGLDWTMGEHFIQVGPYNLNILQSILIIVSVLIPYSYVPYVFLWLLAECIVSRNYMSTGKFISLVCIALIFKYVLSRVFNR
jgi:GR25 family glycosyltransferase involved in LPS biosynthesis